MRELVVATRNQDKLKEIRLLLKGLPIKVISLNNFKEAPEVVEDKPTLDGNARKKAKVISRFLKRLVIADDSGLEIEALGGRPGVYSARFSGKNATYTSNNIKVLDMMEEVPISKRKARFRCMIAIADKGKMIKVVEGKVSGIIDFKARGRTGFGYDPLFKPNGYRKTFAQMPLKEKNEISHRSKALIKAKRAIIEYIS